MQYKCIFSVLYQIKNMKYKLKHKNNLKVILIISFGLSVFGFIMDLNELDPSLLQNFKDVTLMTVLLFGVGLVIYLSALTIKFLQRIIFS